MKNSLKTILTSLFLSILLCLSFFIPTVFNIKTELETRTVDVEEIGTLSYDEKVNQILDSFDDYNIEQRNDAIVFEGYSKISLSNISNMKYLSADAELTTKNFTARLDFESEKFYIKTQIIQDNEIVFEEEVETTPYYDEYEDDYYIQLPDGTSKSLLSVLKTENFDECLFGEAVIIGLTIEEAALLLTTVAIVAAPYVETIVTKVVTAVVSLVRSFLSWFRSIFTKKTTYVETQTITQTITYKISISYNDTITKAEAIPYSKSMQFELGKYYVAIADTDDGLLYVSTKALLPIEALAVLVSSQMVNSAHNGSNKKFVVSLYTFDKDSAREIAIEAGTIMGSSGAIFHPANKVGYFDHYHPGLIYTDLSHPHVFYGSPKA